jgi:surface protein
MKGLKVNMNYVNCALSVVVLILVVICCFKKREEGFGNEGAVADCYEWSKGRRKKCRRYVCPSTNNPYSGKWVKCGENLKRGWCTKNIQYMDKDRNLRKEECKLAEYKMKDSAELREAVDLWRKKKATAITKYGHIGKWDTSNVTDMNYMFYNANEFDEDIGKWDTSNVTSMYGMFMFASKFNQDISLWDIEKVKDMRYMFFHAYKFNQDIRKWKMTKSMPITNMFQNSGYNYPQPVIIALPNNLDVVRWSSRDDGYIYVG